MKISEINKLGKDLELYTTVDYIGKGFPILLPKGARIVQDIRNYVENLEEQNGYNIVKTPNISLAEIYKIEDRYEIEKDEMFIIKGENEEKSGEDGSTIVLRPYVQPFHCSIYKTKKHSYKEMPIKYFETSTVYRNERDIKGITKTRQITMSNASIFINPENIEEEIKQAISMQKELIEKFNLDVKFHISTWNQNKKEEYIGTIDEWNNVTNAMRIALDKLNIKYEVNNKAKMYGPSISVQYNTKVLSSLQVDFEITHRFDLKFTNKENQEEFPFFIHNTIIESYENLLAIVIEKYDEKMKETNNDAYEIENFIKEVLNCQEKY